MSRVRVLRRVVLALSVLLVVLLLTVGYLGYTNRLADQTAQLWVYGITAIAVVGYTVVNWFLVEEVRAQRELVIRPFVVFNIRDEQMAFPTFEILNVGNGTALNVEVGKIYTIGERGDPELDLHYEAVPNTIVVLLPKEPKPIRFQLTAADTPLAEPERGAALQPSRWTHTDFLIQGHYEDIEGRRYPLREQAGKSGLKILAS